MPLEESVTRLNVAPLEKQAASRSLPIALASVRNEIARHLRQCYSRSSGAPTTGFSISTFDAVVAELQRFA